MAKQFRGCSRLVYSVINETTGETTYGAVKELGVVKSISREISSESEEVWGNNALQDTTFGGTSVTRNFECMRIAPEVEAELLGLTTLTIGVSAKKGYLTKADASSRPYIAVGYALHDGNADKPCEVVWAYRGIVKNISKQASTIDRGTGSEGQSVEIVFSAPLKPFTKTGEANLDLCVPVVDGLNVDTFFKQVVTPDNADTTIGA